MPIVHIDMLAGRSAERKADLIRRVTNAIVASLGVQPAQVRVLLNELPAENWGIGGEPIGVQATAERDEGA